MREVHAVAEIVRNHFGRVPMAVASGGEKTVLEATLVAIELRDFFDAIVSIHDVERGKPQPDLFLLAAQKLGVAPQDCIVYEDSDSGLEAACRAGLQHQENIISHTIYSTSTQAVELNSTQTQHSLTALIKRSNTRLLAH